MKLVLHTAIGLILSPSFSVNFVTASCLKASGVGSAVMYVNLRYVIAYFVKLTCPDLIYSTKNNLAQ